MGLSVKRRWLREIFAKRKKWELRGTMTRKRGRIGLIESGSHHVVGEARVTDCMKIAEKGRSGRWRYFPTGRSFLKTYQNHRCRPTDFRDLRYTKVYAWVLEGVVKYKKPVSYYHPVGAVIWVKLCT